MSLCVLYLQKGASKIHRSRSENPNSNLQILLELNLSQPKDKVVNRIFNSTELKVYFIILTTSAIVENLLEWLA